MACPHLCKLRKQTPVISTYNPLTFALCSDQYINDQLPVLGYPYGAQKEASGSQAHRD